jgi:hypothetical protein
MSRAKAALATLPKTSNPIKAETIIEALKS